MWQPNNGSSLFVLVWGPKICPETELGSLAIIFHVKWQPLFQYTVTWETERHFVFLPTIKIKGAGCVQGYVRVWHRMNKKKTEKTAFITFICPTRSQNLNLCEDIYFSEGYTKVIKCVWELQSKRCYEQTKTKRKAI